MSGYSNCKQTSRVTTGCVLTRVAFAGILALGLAGCDQLGIDTPATIQARADQEGKAVGTACRHAMRAMEDCYSMNSKTPKAAIAAGWREMDEYMRDNNIAGVAPEQAKSIAMNQKESGDDAIPTETNSAAH